MFRFGKNKALKNEIADLKEQVLGFENLVTSANISPDSTEWLSFTGGNNSFSGGNVTEKTAMAISSVYACVGLIGGAIGSMPLPIYKRTEKGREKVEHYIHALLNDQPHPIWSAPVFWEYVASSLLMHGDGFVEIIRKTETDRNKPKVMKITGFKPLNPQMVKVVSDGDRVTYEVSEPGNKSHIINSSDMLHIPGLGFNGLRGMSQIKYAARNSIGTAISTEEFSGAFFKNGARPDFVLQADGTVTDEQAQLLRDTWGTRYQGAGKSHLPAVLTGGLKVEQITMSAEDAQLIATRQFQVEDIARFYGVPPHMIGHTQKSTSWGTGVEQLSIGFVKYTLRRHLQKIEKEINRKCFVSNEENNYFCEFNVAGLERGDIKTRNDAYRTSLGRAGEPGWMTVNEIRRKENLAPVEGGDELNKIADTESGVSISDSDSTTINEKRAELGLGPIDGGDAIYMSSSMIPAVEFEAED